MKVVIFVEGKTKRRGKIGPTELHFALRSLLEKTSLKGNLPRVISCGGREQAIKDFSKALSQSTENEYPLLLIDTENVLKNPPQKPDDPGGWEHLPNHACPPGARNDQIAFMATCTESWISASRQSVSKSVGSCFDSSKLHSLSSIETKGAIETINSLKAALKPCGDTRSYEKGGRVFQLLAQCEPSELVANCPQFRRFIEILEKLA